ncbi:hypothetical protein [Rhodococcoides kroppenstedtii]|uniref:hypothetical protein n=1 Tax=Rhodococcoides kroppenstedtii TaxID=293050 RepID=UPI0028EDB711|nr:hypothetical protein [Rhodococcus kroppenstedtii]
MTPALLGTLRRGAGAVAVVAALGLAWVYMQDILNNGMDMGMDWCSRTYGYPAYFDYIPRNSVERISASVTDWWSWTRPGMSCGFVDNVTLDSVVVHPPASRSILAAVLSIILIIAATSFYVLRRQQRRAS